MLMKVYTMGWVGNNVDWVVLMVTPGGGGSSLIWVGGRGVGGGGSRRRMAWASKGGHLSGADGALVLLDAGVEVRELRVLGLHLRLQMLHDRRRGRSLANPPPQEGSKPPAAGKALWRGKACCRDTLGGLDPRLVALF